MSHLRAALLDWFISALVESGPKGRQMLKSEPRDPYYKKTGIRSICIMYMYVPTCLES